MSKIPIKVLLDENKDAFMPLVTTDAVQVQGTQASLDTQLSNLDTEIQGKQETLVSGVNLKTINNNSLLGSGNIDIDLDNTIQFQTMPTPSEEFLGRIVQYTGTTDSNYTNGYFYICLSDGGIDPTYTWVNKNVQPNIDSHIYYIAGTTSSNPFIFDEHKTGVYFFAQNQVNFYVKGTAQNTSYYTLNVDYGVYLNYYRPYSLADDDQEFAITSYYPFSGSAGSYTISRRALKRKLSENSGVYFVTKDTKFLNYVTSNTDQTVSGTKTFSTLPESSGVPTTANQLVNKTYVDNSTPQVSTMPTASADNLGKILQYTGITDATYTNGYFYICVSDGESTPTYSWTQINVQPSGVTTGLNSYYYDLSYSNPLVFDDNPTGIYFFKPNLNTLYCKGASTNNMKSVSSFRNMILVYYKKYSEAANDEEIAYICYGVYTGANVYNKWIGITKSNNTQGLNTSENAAYQISAVTPGDNQTISGLKTFTTLPQSSATPTDNKDLTTKGYVDGAIQTIQYSTMPSAAAANEGKIVQYTGTTDTNYTNGYFYQCVSDGAVSPTYSWEELEVQASNSSDNSYLIANFPSTSTNSTTHIIVITSNTNINQFYYNAYLQALINGIADSKILYPTRIYFAMYMPDRIIETIDYYNKNSTNTQSVRYYVRTLDGATKSGNVYIYNNSGTISFTGMSYNDVTTGLTSSLVGLNNAQTISGLKTFSTLPQSSVTPSNNSDLVTKAYVDGKLSNAHYIETNDSTHPFVFSEHEVGVYFFNTTLDTLYFKGTTESTATVSRSYARGVYLVYYKDYASASNYEEIARTSYERLYGSTGDMMSKQIILTKRTDANAGVTVSEDNATALFLSYVALTNNQTINGVKTFSSLPQSSAIPSNNNDLVNKSYVDTTVVTDVNTTYTITTLDGNSMYKLGELTALTISAVGTINKEANIFFTSDGTSGCVVSLPSTITNLGDVPTMTEVAGVNSGTTTADKKYIISILNDVAVWKEY